MSEQTFTEQGLGSGDGAHTPSGGTLIIGISGDATGEGQIELEGVMGGNTGTVPFGIFNGSQSRYEKIVLDVGPDRHYALAVSAISGVNVQGRCKNHVSGNIYLSILG